MEIVIHQERSDEPRRLEFISKNRMDIEAAANDAANARARRWEARYNEARRRVAELEKELEDNAKLH